jgi:carboxyl-terminal processing protease
MFFKLKKFLIVATLLYVVPARSQSMMQGGKLDQAMEMIKYFYVDTVNEKKLTDNALHNLMKDLDPHSAYISPEEMREMNEPLVGKFEGIGIQFQILNDTIMVTQTIPGGPSEKVGLRQGDRIVKVNGINEAGIKIKNNDVLKLLRGDKGTKVTVSVFRRGAMWKKEANDLREGGDNLIDFTITRDQIPLFSVDATYMVTPKIGYIKISRFADQTVEEFKKALETLKGKGMEALILDLQENGGGYLNRAVEMGDEFLPAGKKIVYTRGRNSPAEDYVSTATGGWEKGKLAILIDQGTASASEIVSGAVQDWDRGLIVGRRSFGKGLVQKPFQFPDGSMLRLTVAHYYTPSGRCIQKPYKPGEMEEYELDVDNRYKSGELMSADSIHFNDTTKYFTSHHRLVHGGGGIMPDVFVPLDTTEFSTFYSDLLRKGAFNEYLVTYVDNNRADFKKSYPTLDDFKKNYTVSQKLFGDFLDNAEKLGVMVDTSVYISDGKTGLKRDTIKLNSKERHIDRNNPGLKISERLIRLQIKALIARDLWNVEGYFEVINEANTSLRKAIEAITDNTFDRLKIAEK